ncbi:hypothetical protein [Roseateles chitinivorans]|uniref:hypothetical protein n=1 Tax=Roseateles chitinivorans TaxID=2917965 RepID=UPI003D673C07
MGKKTILLGLLVSVMGTATANDSKEHCKKELEAIAGLPLEQHELALLEANNRLLKRFVEYQEMPNVSPQDQKWSYISWSVGGYVLGQQSYRSPRVQLVILGFSENAADFLRKKRTYEQFSAENEALGLKSDRLRQELLKFAPNVQRDSGKEIKSLADCAQATGMMVATQQLKGKPQ